MNRRSYVGENNPNYGKRLSDAAKKSISDKAKIRLTKPENHPNYKPKVRKICPICGKEFLDSPAHANDRVCCSRKCKGEYQSQYQKGEGNPFFGRHHSCETSIKMSNDRRGERNHQWRGGSSFEPYCVLFNDEFRERVRIYFGYICVECGTPQNGRNHTVHHVNYDKETCCNKKIPLFVCLCNSCNGKANKNRPYWEQHFTEMINNYYGGKCYLSKEEMKAYLGATA
jgi:hypothetical protein